jgi:DNA-binding GntR family transcriptional regulator
MERAIPRYLWVCNALKNQIETEDHEVSDFLPPEPERLQIPEHSPLLVVRRTEVAVGTRSQAE